MVMVMNLIKTPEMKIPGVFLCLFFAHFCLADCGQSTGELVPVAKVIDGDTLRLKDGRSVRVIGINAPEVRHGAKPGQPLGVDARMGAQAFIDAAGGRVRLGYESEKQDRYDRQLAHVYNARGESLGVALLSRGLVFAVAVPPNVAQADCLYTQQKKAYQQRKGIWGDKSWTPRPSAGLDFGDAGFQRIKGRVEQVTINSSVWIELEGKLVLQIARSDWKYFPQKPRNWLDMKGKTLETEGWVVVRKQNNKHFKPMVMKVRSPHALRLASP